MCDRIINDQSDDFLQVEIPSEADIQNWNEHNDCVYEEYPEEDDPTILDIDEDELDLDDEDDDED